jgi:hypothetical protein
MRLFPSEFRHEYGDDMLEFFRDRWHDEHSRAGWRGVARLWMRALFDLTTAAVHEHIIAAFRERRPLTSPPGDHMLQALGYDLKFSGRMLRKNPVITAVAIIVIALGTGAVSTIFSIANAIVLRPLPGVSRASELVVVERLKPSGGTITASYPYFRHLSSNARTVNVAAWSAIPLTVSTGGEAVAPLGNIVSGNYFDVLGVRPALGRFFTGDEIRVPDTYPVVVISHDFWRRQLSGDSAAIGRTILVNRGWTPQGPSRAAPPAVPPPPGTVTVVGRIATPPAGFFELESTPPAGNVWQNLDPARFTAATGIPVLDAIVEATRAPVPDDGLVRDWPAPDFGIEKHRIYMLQWYAFAALAVALWIVVPLRRRAAGTDD